MSPKLYATLMIVTVFIGVFLLPMVPFQSSVGAQNQANPAFAHDTEGWFAREFDPKTHVRALLPPPLRTDSLNPNLKKPLAQYYTYEKSLRTTNPGIEYDTRGTPVRAVAAGIVHFIGETPKKAGAPGGAMFASPMTSSTDWSRTATPGPRCIATRHIAPRTTICPG